MLQIVHPKLYQHIIGFKPKIILVCVFHVCTNSILIRFLVSISLTINVNVLITLNNNVSHQVTVPGQKQTMNVLHKFAVK